MNDSIVPMIAETLGITVKNRKTLNQEWLASLINHLLEKDFERLIYLLYRMDVNEAKLKRLLKENEGKDAGLIIAGLMIERQLQKIKSREEHKQKGDIDENERW